MNQAFLSTLCLAALLAATVPIKAQPASETQTAIEAAVKRQAALVEVREHLANARAAEARREIVAAAQGYNNALQRLENIGGDVARERADAVAGLARTTLQLADQAMRRGQYDEAKAHIDRVLTEDPRNEMALKMRAQNDRYIAETLDKTPHPEALAHVAATETNRIEVARLVQDGKLYYETGRLKEAEDVLRRAIRMDPGNRAAAYYLDLVHGRKYSEELRLREVNSKQLLLEVEEAWAAPVTREILPVPNPYGRSNLVHTSSERQKIFQKLNTIRLNELGPYDSLPLSEVIRSLNDEAVKRDLEGKGVNFLISPNSDTATPPAAAGGAIPGAAPGFDQAGIPVAPLPLAEPFDLNGVTIRIGTPLRDVTLLQALEIITAVADRKIKYSVEDYGVVLSPKAPEAVPLHTRFFKVDPNTFWQGLQNVTALDFGVGSGGFGGGGGGFGGGGGGSRGSRGGGGGFGGGGGGFGGSGQGIGGGAEYAQVSIAPGGSRSLFGQQGIGLGQQVGGQQQPGQFGQGSGGIRFLTEVTSASIVTPIIQNFFQSAGVTLTDPGKAVFFNDRTGILMVRATLQDLDTIEKAVQMLNVAPPQLTIRAKFMEVTQNDNRALGFDWFIGNTLLRNGTIGAQAGSAPSYYVPGAESVANPSGVFPGPSAVPGVPGPFGIPASPTDNLLTSGLRNGAPALATVTGILTDPQFRVVVRALEQRGGTDLLQCPEVTTMSGRQAQIKVVDVRYVVTDLDLNQTAAGGAVATGIGQTGGGGVGTTIQPLAEPFELGPVLDVVPYVNADGYTIQLTILPTLKEFLGYDDPGQFLAQAQSVGAAGPVGTALTAITPLPIFRLRQVATTAMVWDGQTVVLGGLIAEDVQKTQDKVPVLADIPWIGRFFRSDSNNTRKKNLVIFVTPTLIDPAGNRLHSEEEMPFAQNSIPSQEPRVINP